MVALIHRKKLFRHMEIDKRKRAGHRSDSGSCKSAHHRSRFDGWFAAGPPGVAEAPCETTTNHRSLIHTKCRPSHNHIPADD